jgi:hypothetical protein
MSPTLNLPDWLPAPLLFQGDSLDRFVAETFTIFDRNFIQTQPYYKTKPIRINATPTLLGYPETFWHCCSKDSDLNDGQRLPDFERCRRVPWLKPLLVEGVANNTVVFLPKRKEAGRERLNLNWWDHELGQRIILEDRKHFWKLITTFHFSPKQLRFQKEILAAFPSLNSQFPLNSEHCITLTNQKGATLYG